MPWGRRWRALCAGASVAIVIGVFGWLWFGSLVRGPVSAAEMGVVDPGGSHAGHLGAAVGRSIEELAPAEKGVADVQMELVARSGPAGLSFNGRSPGPVIEVNAGQLLEVRLRNESVAGGTTIHWHGVDVPITMDGVAGVSQDAVPIGEEFSYRFRPRRAGTYWYHSHQRSRDQVHGGLFGALVVHPEAGPEPGVKDLVAVVQSLGAQRTINGQPGTSIVPAKTGQKVRVRVVNPQDGEISAWVQGASFKMVAIDSTAVHEPGLVRDQRVRVTAGGRADLLVEVPASGAAIDLGGVQLQLGSAPPAQPRPKQWPDPLSYGTAQPIGFDPQQADRVFEYAIGRRPGFVRGKPGAWWSINGRLYPHVPMFMVRTGEIVRVQFSSSNDVHPMHLHGHRMLVLSRNGVASSGSPWWVDSLDMARGERYEVAFIADNPGIWPFHCHNLEHAADGLVAHLMYEGVQSPYRIGGGNEPD